MKYLGKAEESAAKILEAFKNGGLPKALAPVFIRRKDGLPCRAWSWGNQLLCILNGTHDARGFRQWTQAGRHVKKGAKAFHIFVPLIKQIVAKDAGTGEERRASVLYGFNTAPVFGIENTEGEALPPVDEDVLQWLDNLPLVEVARSWGLKVDAYDGSQGAPQGKYRRNQLIALGVKNLSTWTHELIHAADDRLGTLKETGQHWRSETVAELGGAILLEALGHSTEADIGGCFRYIENYADAAGVTPLQACMEVLKRTCDAVDLLLNEAEKLSAALV